MADENKCPKCGSQLPSDSPQGLCPQCLMKLGLPSAANPQGAVPTTPNAPVPFVPPQPEELAAKFPQLEIIQLLGQGGMGAVYRARQKHLDRLVALKILPPQIGQDPAFAERFTREARSLARLHHPQIVTVFEFGHTDDGLYYFIMEYVDGTDLRQIIKAGQFSPKEALAIVPQICEALQFAHEEGIVHRDIKPENILIDKRGRIKIADFGLARLLDQPAKEYTLTQAGQRMGTPHYMAPEQIERPAEVDHRADIYSLGVVFYEMLTGELPIGRFDPPSQKVQVDVRLDEIVLHTLEKEPQRRYQHASEIKTDVETVSSTNQSLPAATAPATNISPMDKHVTLLAAIYIGFGILGLFGASIAFTAIVGGGLLSGDWEASRITSIVGPAVFTLISIMSIPSVIAGFGLLKRRPWARILTIILAIFGIFQFPWGTAIGIYAFWVLLQSQTAKLFEPASRDSQIARKSPIPTPQSQVRTPESRPTSQPGIATAQAPASPAIYNFDTVRSRLRIPATALMIAGIIGCIGIPLLIAAASLVRAVTGHGFAVPLGIPGVLEIVIQAMTLIVGILVTIGASSMLRLRSYGFSVATAILAIIPCYLGFPIGLPFGIWALVVLSSLETQEAFAKQKHNRTQPSSHRGRNLVISLIIVIILAIVGTLIIRTMPQLLGSDTDLSGRPLSFNLELQSERIGQLDFPAGRTDHLTLTLGGLTLSESGASAMGLTPEQTDRINEILRTAYAEYAQLEKNNSQFSTSADSLSVTVSPFRQEAAHFLDTLWTRIDDVCDKSQRPAVHQHLPLGRIFGTFGFGKHKISINISKRANRFAYKVSWYHTEGPGPMGQVASISSDSSRTLPFELYRFWNAQFQTDVPD